MLGWRILYPGGIEVVVKDFRLKDGRIAVVGVTDDSTCVYGSPQG